MRNKFYSLLLAVSTAFILGSNSLKAEEALWLRYPQISPNGKEIAFAYKGDIYIVDVNGGKARQITTHTAYEYAPIWSPSGNKLAFASAREGSFDIYVVDAQGGSPLRLTTHSGSEIPECFLNEDEILYSAYIMPTAQSMQFPSSSFKQVYKVSTSASKPELYLPYAMNDINISKDGKILYTDIKGYEDSWRKHHTSSVTRDNWLFVDGKHIKLSDFKGEDRSPVWSPDGSAYYYLCEESGSFNVFKADVSYTGGKVHVSNKQQITNFDTHPVRFLSISQDGILCFTYNGEIYTLKPNSTPQKISVDIRSDKAVRDLHMLSFSSGVTDFSVSPNGKEIAFILRSDVFVTSIDHKTTRQISFTPEMEKNIEFSPDGRSIVYASERDGLWQIYECSLQDKNDELFVYATDIVEKNISNSDQTSFNPKYSPDGKEIAFFRNRTEICVQNLKTNKVRTVQDAKYLYSYQDGDIDFSWSPDGKWILSDYFGVGGWNHSDIALVKADGSGEIHNLTNSGYAEGGARWALDGKAMIFFSDRSGYRSHGSWGSERDIYIMFFDKGAYDRFLMTKDDIAHMDEINKGKKKDSEKDTSKKEEKKIEDLSFDFDYLEERTIRLSKYSDDIYDAFLNKDGSKLYYLSPDNGKIALWESDLKEKKTEIKLRNVMARGLTPSKDFKHIFAISGGKLKKIDMGSFKEESISFEALCKYDQSAERAYLLNHMQKQVADKFYDPSLRGMDWYGYYENYAKFLPHINNGYDFSALASELLGELNASHTGCRFSTMSKVLTVGELGCFIDHSYDGDGIKIREIVYNSPLALADKKIEAGSIITHIDGKKIEKGVDYYPLLEGKEGVRTRLTIEPAKGKAFDVIIKPISSSAMSELLYARWVKRNRQLVDSLSGGRIAYVHIQGMNSPSFRTVYKDLLNDANRNKNAVIVDTRHNGGGWLHDDVASLLSGKLYARFEPRGQFVSDEPHSKWTKPSCMLVGEDNYSDAHGTPWVYKTLGIGKLVGAPVPGTMTAVWWERLSGGYVFGIPQVGTKDMNGNYLENQELQPDILIYNTQEALEAGRDLQIEAAVEDLLKNL